MYKASELNISQVLTAIPAEYWEEAQEIRDALNLYTGSGKKIKQLQEIAMIFSLGSVYGEELAIRRINYLEKQVNDLTDLNKRLTDALKDAIRENQSTQDVKQED